MSGNVFVIPTADPSGATSSYALKDLQMNVVQLAGTTGEVKLIPLSPSKTLLGLSSLRAAHPRRISTNSTRSCTSSRAHPARCA